MAKSIKLLNKRLVFLYINNKKITPRKGRYNFYKNFDEAVEKYLVKLRSDSLYNDFRIFSREDDALEWGLEHYGKWKSNLSSEEVYCIEGYAGNVYFPINNYLRRGSKDYNNQSLEKEVMHIDNALKRTEIAQNIIVFRWLSYEGFCELLNYKEIFVGDVLEEKAYLSTSLICDKDIANPHDENETLVLLIIRVPEGLSGAFIADVSLYMSTWELEILLSRGQKLRIAEIIYYKKDGKIILCDIV